MSDSRSDQNSSQLMPGVKRLCLAMLAAGAVCFCFTLITGFEWRNALGFAVGTLYACGCMLYLAASSERAVKTGSTAKAKRIMRSCYGIRLSLLTVLCAAAMLTGAMSPVGIIVPQLFPRILLTGAHFMGRDFFGNDKTGKEK